MKVWGLLDKYMEAIMLANLKAAAFSKGFQCSHHLFKTLLEEPCFKVMWRYCINRNALLLMVSSPKNQTNSHCYGRCFCGAFWKQRSVSASVRKTLSEPTFRPKTSPKHFEIKLIQHYFSIISEMETMTSFMWTISAVLQVLPRVICYWNHRVCFQWSAPCRYKPYPCWREKR